MRYQYAGSLWSYKWPYDWHGKTPDYKHRITATLTLRGVRDGGFVINGRSYGGKPKLSDLRGMAKDAFGDISSTDYIDFIRNMW